MINDVFGISDNERSNFSGDWSRSSKRTELLHGIIANHLLALSPILKIEK